MSKTTYKIGRIEGELPVREGMLEHKFVVMASESSEGNLELTLYSRAMNNPNMMHENIVKEVSSGGRCIGGGCIAYLDFYGGTSVKGESTVYGPVHTQIRDAFGNMLSEFHGIKYVGCGVASEERKNEINQEWEKRNNIQLETKK